MGRPRCGPTTSSGNTTPRAFPGRGGMKEDKRRLTPVQQTVGKWDKFELSADEFFEQGDTVVALGHIDAAKDDQSVRLPVVHIWRYRGEQICRLEIITDTLTIAKLLGLA